MPYAYQPYGPGSTLNLPTFNYGSLAGGFPAMLGAYTSAMNQYNTANAQRYQDILAGYRDLGAEQEQRLAGMGTQRAADITQNTANLQSRARQEMTGAGFAGSGMMYGALGSIGREGERAQSDWADQLARMRLDIGGRNATAALQFMERPTLNPPDLGQFASLAQAYGAGQQTQPRYNSYQMTRPYNTDFGTGAFAPLQRQSGRFIGGGNLSGTSGYAPYRFIG